MHLHMTTEGRIGRKEYWMGLIYLALLGTGLHFLMVLLFSLPPTGRGVGGLFTASMIILFLLFLWPTICLQTRRFHDKGMSGWSVLLNLIPFVGPFITLIMLGFIKGEDAANQYGENPLNEQMVFFSRYSQQY